MQANPKQNLKVLHLPSDVGGLAWQLAAGERALGLDSKVLVARTNWMQYPADYKLHLERKQNRIAKFFSLARSFVAIRRKYNIFHFNFGSSLINVQRNHLLSNLDASFYPSSARLFVTYCGCDARQSDLTAHLNPFAPCHNSLCANGACNDGALDNWRRQSISKLSHRVEHMWALNPDLLRFLPKEKSSFLPYAIKPSGDVNYFSHQSGRLRIVHAPTDRIIKGTDYLLQALAKLNSTHPDCFELVLVEGRPHAEAIEIYRTADLIVDQLSIGWYGSLAAECMALGKPVITWVDDFSFNNVATEMTRDIRQSMLLANRDSLYSTLVSCVENRAILRHYSEAAYQYARRWHDPSYVAGLTLQKYEAAFS